MPELFYNKFNDLISKKRNDNSFFLSAEKYKFLISEVNISKDKSNKQRNDYRRLKRYDFLIQILSKLLNILGSTKLIVLKNITYEIVRLYLSLCIQCQTKQKAPRKGIVVKPIISSELNSRCQINLVDMQTCKDGEYKFILNYQDHLTEFIQLRPLKSKTAEVVVHNLLHIF